MIEPKTLLKLLLGGLVALPACTATTATTSVTPVEFASQVAADRDQAPVVETTVLADAARPAPPSADEGPTSETEEHDAVSAPSRARAPMAVDICMDGCFQQRHSLLHCVAACRPTPW